MKKINLNKMMLDNGFSIDRKEILGMEFIKHGDNYIIKGSNGVIVSEEEKLKIENKELVLQDISSDCAKDITKKITKNKKRIKEINEDIEETIPTKE